ncbi:MAG TPA: hypothetical protein VIV66_09925 [Pyrinomonadaceae bacterium]
MNLIPRVLVVISFLTLTALSYGKPPDQPFMQAALDDLRKSKAELQVAEHNKGGHRAKALGLVNSAISEVNKGIAFARHYQHPQTDSNATSRSLTTFPDQPHMRAALALLEDAKRNLDSAVADKGGHRAKAIELVNAAIDEVNKGIEAGA